MFPDHFRHGRDTISGTKRRALGPGSPLFVASSNRKNRACLQRRQWACSIFCNYARVEAEVARIRSTSVGCDYREYPSRATSLFWKTAILMRPLRLFSDALCVLRFYRIPCTDTSGLSRCSLMCPTLEHPITMWRQGHRKSRSRLVRPDAAACARFRHAFSAHEILQ